MTITEIRKIEEERKDQLDVVHLIKESSFYYANDKVLRYLVYIYALIVYMFQIIH